MSAAELVAWVVALYFFISLDVLLLEGYEWLRDALYARHVRRCPEDHGDWRPRWTHGVAREVAGTLLRVVLWPVMMVSEFLDWVGSLRARWAARRALPEEVDE